MAIQFNPNALSMFSGVNFGNDNAIANLGGDEKLVQKDKLGLFLWKPFRSDDTEKRNNAVRTELLRSLGIAFKLQGISDDGYGNLRFTDTTTPRWTSSSRLRKAGNSNSTFPTGWAATCCTPTVPDSSPAKVILSSR